MRYHISQELAEVLSKIRSSSAIANALLELASSPDVSGRAGEIHIGDDGPDINYLSVSSEDPSKISYLTSERARRMASISEDPSVMWLSSGRFHGRPASVVSKIFKSIRMKDLEVFANVFKAVTSEITFEFKVVSGEAIRHWYHEGTYVRGASDSLGTSCMKHPVCQGFLDIYVENPDVVSMLTMVNKGGMLLGRALLWDFENLADGARVKAMDRIYTANDSELTYHFKAWAKDNGYLYKSAQKWNNPLDFTDGQSQSNRRFSLRLSSWDFESFPYMDTFKFLDRSTGVISNHLNGKPSTLCAADGRHQGWDYLCEDSVDGLYFQRNEMTQVKYMPCGPGGESFMTHCNNVHFSDVNRAAIMKADSMHDPIINDYLFANEHSHLNNWAAIAEMATDRARMDFHTFVHLRSKEMSIGQIIKNLHQLKEEWGKNMVEIREMVDRYYGITEPVPA